MRKKGIATYAVVGILLFSMVFTMFAAIISAIQNV